MAAPGLEQYHFIGKDIVTFHTLFWLHYWVPSIAPSGMAFLTSDRYGAAWRGSLFVGSLKFGTLHRFEVAGGKLQREEKLLQGNNEVDQMSKIFELCGVPTDEVWPGFRRLPNARSLKLPKTGLATGS
ncbi:MAG: hypothetical protein M1823_008846, partial [Watsoniomyces obsoletus]